MKNLQKNHKLVIRTRGILPIQQLKLLRDAGILHAPKKYPIQDDQFQPNSLDLRLGTTAYRIRCSFLPEKETVENKLQRLSQHTINIQDGAVLEQNCTYLIPLLEELYLPLTGKMIPVPASDHLQRKTFTTAATTENDKRKGPYGDNHIMEPQDESRINSDESRIDSDENRINSDENRINSDENRVNIGDNDFSLTLITEEPLSARANPKSSTGRLDIFTRLITDYSHRFEDVSPGYQGKLYLEVVPKSFPVRVKTGQRLNQMRIRHGQCLLSDQDMLQTHLQDPILFDELGKPLPVDQLNVNNGLFLRVGLHGEEGEIVGYKAKKHRDLIDLERNSSYNVLEYWDPIYARKDDYLILEPEAFYIFASRERCRIPRHLAAEMVPYDTGSGELRTHYAGFFDSGFGGSVEEGGARAVLEVRSHDVPFLIEDGQTFFRMIFEPNTEIPDVVYGEGLKSNYQGQSLKLGKHFKPS